MNPRNVEEVLEDFKGRRAGIIKALTKDVELFYNLCDPNDPNLCLYGLPDKEWEVNSQPSLPPSELPEPRSGINRVRDATTKEEWLSMVALHSDAWLHAIASYFSAKRKFDKADRKRLFNKILDMSLISDLIMGGTSQKRAKAMYSSLPDDILVDEVLPRLPVKDLTRYKLVCNKWRSTIDAPKFIWTHQRSYKGNIAENQLLVVTIDGWRSRRQNSEQVLIRRSDTFRKVTQLKNLDHMDRCRVLGYINGLALVTRNEIYGRYREIVLWNPSINTFFNVPPFSEVVVHYFHVGLGFDSSKKDYKVVQFTHTCPQLNPGIPGFVQVYTLSTNSWTTKPNVLPPSNGVDGSQVFFNGAIHWMTFVPNDLGILLSVDKYPEYIVSFEVGDEVFNELELPSDVKGPVGDILLTVMDDCLAMLCQRSEHHVWVMKDYGDSNSWIKCYTFTLLGDHDELLYFKGNGELLYANLCGIMSYDVKSNQVRSLARTYCKNSYYKIYTYVESLVLSSLPFRVTEE